MPSRYRGEKRVQVYPYLNLVL